MKLLPELGGVEASDLLSGGRLLPLWCRKDGGRPEEALVTASISGEHLLRT